MIDDPVQFLVEGAARLGLDLDAPEAEALLRFKAELLSWNRRFNLTALTTDEAVLEKHFLDSLAVWPIAGFPDGMRALDLGTGAGLPGLVLALYGRRRLQGGTWTLVDATMKKVGFVEHAAGLLGLSNVLAVRARGEELGRQAAYREAFDRVLARAVARMAVLVEYSLPLVRVGGRFLAMKGPMVAGELDAAGNAIHLLGGEVASIYNYTLPYSGDHRSILVIEKVRPTPAAYPRRVGVPARCPL